MLNPTFESSVATEPYATAILNVSWFSFINCLVMFILLLNKHSLIGLRNGEYDSVKRDLQPRLSIASIAKEEW